MKYLLERMDSHTYLGVEPGTWVSVEEAYRWSFEDVAQSEAEDQTRLVRAQVIVIQLPNE